VLTARLDRAALARPDAVEYVAGVWRPAGELMAFLCAALDVTF
jgi:hypothetical protein